MTLFCDAVDGSRLPMHF